MRTLILGLAAVLLPLPASADEVYLKGGGQVSGRIVSRTATLIEIDVGAGRIGVTPASVLRIEEGRSPLHEYEDRASRLGPGDVEGWLALGDWARTLGLGSQATAAYNRALSAAPGDPRANAALGRVVIDGRWVSEDEGYRAKGFVRFEGEWIDPRRARGDPARARGRGRAAPPAPAGRIGRARGGRQGSGGAGAGTAGGGRGREGRRSGRGPPALVRLGRGPRVWPTIVSRPVGDLR